MNPIAFFDAHEFERPFFAANEDFPITFFATRLEKHTAHLARGFNAIICFVNDRLNADVLKILAESGVRYIGLRSAGFNNVDLDAAKSLNIAVARVPDYSPYAVAEHTTALLMILNRKIHRAHNRVRESNFSLNGLVGFDIHGKTVGVVGTGKIGRRFCKIMLGFGAHVLAFDSVHNDELRDEGVEYVDLHTLLRDSKVISLHVPLTKQTYHLIDEAAFARMQNRPLLLNTGRGALIDTKSLIRGLKSGRIEGAALDVYEEEEGIFFEDFSDKILKDDDLARLLTFPNVLITSHQAFLTQEALSNIAQTTLANLATFLKGERNANFLV